MGILPNYFTSNLYFKKMIESQKWSTKSSNEHRFEIYAHYQHHWTTHLETYRELTFGKHWGLATKLFQHLQEEKQKLKFSFKKKSGSNKEWSEPWRLWWDDLHSRQQRYWGRASALLSPSLGSKVSSLKPEIRFIPIHNKTIN